MSFLEDSMEYTINSEKGQQNAPQRTDPFRMRKTCGSVLKIGVVILQVSKPQDLGYEKKFEKNRKKRLTISKSGAILHKLFERQSTEF